MSFTKNTSKNIGRNLSGKCSQKLIDSAKKSARDALKIASKRAVWKKAEATSDLMGNKIVDKSTKASRSSPTNSSEIVESEAENTGFDREILKDRQISPERRREKLLMI